MKNYHFLPILLLILVHGLSVSMMAEAPLIERFHTQKALPKTQITITYPTAGTVWNAPDTVELKWDTKNIPENKTLKFYLSNDDMVVQELGIFQNKKFVGGIPLSRSLQTSDKYRVIAIELFPDDKYSIAKYATPLFTITKAPREIIVENVVAANKPAPPREMFDGRKLNYVNEMEVSSSDIQISLWDHSRKDGDIVSIYLNGEAIVAKYALEYHKRKFEIKLDPSKPNDLFLYAHNLGRFPPNTVSIEIKDGKTSEKIILNSDLKSCEAIMINVKK